MLIRHKNSASNNNNMVNSPSNNLNDRFSMDNCTNEDVEVEDEMTEDDDYRNSPSKRTKGEKSNLSRSKSYQRKGGRKEITKEEIKKYFNVSQSKAAKLLGVSVSTLKRRFYSMDMGRWPYPGNRYSARKRTISYICSPNNRPEKQLDPHTLHVLLRAFKSSNLDNVLLSSNGQQ
jgi:DNA-binding transcriptional regulator YiaG